MYWKIILVPKISVEVPGIHLDANVFINLYIRNSLDA